MTSKKKKNIFIDDEAQEDNSRSDGPRLKKKRKDAEEDERTSEIILDERASQSLNYSSENEDPDTQILTSNIDKGKDAKTIKEVQGGSEKKDTRIEPVVTQSTGPRLPTDISTDTRTMLPAPAGFTYQLVPVVPVNYHTRYHENNVQFSRFYYSYYCQVTPPPPPPVIIQNPTVEEYNALREDVLKVKDQVVSMALKKLTGAYYASMAAREMAGRIDVDLTYAKSRIDRCEGMVNFCYWACKRMQEKNLIEAKDVTGNKVHDQYLEKQKQEMAEHKAKLFFI